MDDSDTLGEALKDAVKAAGGPVGLSRLLGDISSQAISQWRRVPAERVIAVETATGIPRTKLRPDIYPEPVEARAG